MRKMLIGINFDEMLSRLSTKIKAKKFVFSEIRKVQKKHYQISRRDIVKFNNAYSLASKAWVNTQRIYTGDSFEYSNVLMIKRMIELEPWLVKEFKLSEKKLQKLYDSYDLTMHLIRTSRIVRSLIEQIDIESAHYNYNNNKGK